MLNNFLGTTTVEGRQIELIIWDNNGLEEYIKLGRLSYEDEHVVLTCFDIGDPDSFKNIEQVVSFAALVSSEQHIEFISVEYRGRNLPQRRAKSTCRL